MKYFYISIAEYSTGQFLADQKLPQDRRRSYRRGITRIQAVCPGVSGPTFRECQIEIRTVYEYITTKDSSIPNVRESTLVQAVPGLFSSTCDKPWGHEYFS